MDNKLNRAFVKQGRLSDGILAPAENWEHLPERVLQFGTGVLLRGLPDYFIDKANRQGIFNGRIAVVKSTDRGGTDEFASQDGLYTLHVKGLEAGKEVEESIVISALSRVLIAGMQWEEILEVATNPDIATIISNTTEVGIALDEKDDLRASPPASFPAKLTALLYRRFMHFRGDTEKGWVILPTELVSDNGAKLKAIVLELAERHGLGSDFIHWVREANDFCNTLVDRIVPGSLPTDQLEESAARLGYTDELAIMAEPFRLWAVESESDRVRERLSFARADEGMVIASDIRKFKELKLRLLNGSHTFSCGLAVLCGFATVKEAMQHPGFVRYLNILMREELVPAVVGDHIGEAEATRFAGTVIDRFSNPFLDHPWLNISLNYTSKMEMRNVALIQRFSERRQSPPILMALGFAAYLRFMHGKEKADGRYEGRVGDFTYIINDAQAAYFADLWERCEVHGLVDTVLANSTWWQMDLGRLPGFSETVKYFLQRLSQGDALEVLYELGNEQQVSP